MALQIADRARRSPLGLSFGSILGPMAGSHGAYDPANENLGSDRSFGLMFAVIFLLLLVLIHWRHESITGQAMPFLLTLSGLSFVVSLIRPTLLRRFHYGWMAFSRKLSRIVSPVVLAVLYFILVAPLAVVLRLGGRDVLRLRTNSVASHWRRRVQQGYSLEQFRNQY